MPTKPKTYSERRVKPKPIPDNRPGSAARGYNIDWQRARALWLSEHPLCASCGKPASVVDHIEPHRGDTTKFWDAGNWQSLCRRCHNKKTASGS